MRIDFFKNLIWVSRSDVFCMLTLLKSSELVIGAEFWDGNTFCSINIGTGLDIVREKNEYEIIASLKKFSMKEKEDNAQMTRL